MMENLKPINAEESSKNKQEADNEHSHHVDDEQKPEEIKKESPYTEGPPY
jgi:hypothetical protein